MELILTEDKMNLDKVVEDPGKIFVMAVVEWIHALHTLSTVYKPNSLHHFRQAYWKLPFLLPKLLYALMMNGFGVESIIAHYPMLLLLSTPVIPCLFHRHSIVTKVTHCVNSTGSVCKKINEEVSRLLKALWVIGQILHI